MGRGELIMSAVGSDEGDEVYYSIKNFLETHSISELMEILQYVFQGYSFRKENE